MRGAWIETELRRDALRLLASPLMRGAWIETSPRRCTTRR